MEKDFKLILRRSRWKKKAKKFNETNMTWDKVLKMMQAKDSMKFGESDKP